MKPSFRNLFLLAATGIIGLGLGFQVAAHSGAAGIVKVRMEMMKDIGANLKVLGGMLKGSVPFDAGKAAIAAKTISDHGATIPGSFPNGSVDHPSEALPAIWVDWKKFEAISANLTQNASALAGKLPVAESMQDVKPEFLAIAATCKSCHQTFRLKKN